MEGKMVLCYPFQPRPEPGQPSPRSRGRVWGEVSMGLHCRCQHWYVLVVPGSWPTHHQSGSHRSKLLARLSTRSVTADTGSCSSQDEAGSGPQDSGSPNTGLNLVAQTPDLLQGQACFCGPRIYTSCQGARLPVHSGTGLAPMAPGSKSAPEPS